MSPRSAKHPCMTSVRDLWRVVAIALLCFQAATSARLIDFDEELATGHERLRQLAHRYETVDVDTAHHLHGVRQRRATQGDNTYSHPPSTNFDIQAFGQTFRLQLELNTMLLPVGTQVRYFKENGELVVDHDAVNCYYQGEMDGFSHGTSHAVINTCNGISGSFGVGPAGHWTMERTFFIEPLTKEPTPNGTHLHAVYKVGDSKENVHLGSCGVSTNQSQDHASPLDLAEGILNVDTDTVHTHQRTKRQTSSSVTRYVELLLVLDATLYKSSRVNRDLTVAANRARSVANFVDSLYRQLNIRVPLVAVEIFNMGNRFVTSSIADTMLDNFLAYRTAQLVGRIAHDNAQLMSGIDFAGSTTGITPVSGMCSSARSAGVNQDTASAFSAVAGTMVHQMGHNLGMGHDNGRICTCTASSSAGGCIMATHNSRVLPSVWSSCSRSDLSTFLSRGASSCMDNQPTTLFGDPVCGNGFVEGTEQCDCGTAAQCTTTCCNPATCRFTTGSQCSDGPCCQNCRYRATGTLCRSAVNSCDVAETCSGLTHTCPDDIFAQNGQTCGSGSLASFCYDGQCNTHDTQCKRTWGMPASVAPQICYDQNTQGSGNANCGSTSTNYLRCAATDARCGRLQCIGGAPYTIISSTSRTSTITIRYSQGTVVCKSSTIPRTSDMVDFSLVADGSPCGSSSLCVSQRCRSISSLGITPCPSSGGRVCAGNGVCTNLNSCLCNRGWTGADCSRPVNGQWSPWTVWSGCSQSCGTSGVRTRTRDCDNPPPSNGGTVCRGATSERETCNLVQCPTPVNGNWTPWGAWSGCSATCGGGTRFRLRTCSNPPPSNDGSQCSDSFLASEQCNTAACPTWGPWGPYSSCSKTCGGGVSVRSRLCPLPGECSPGAATYSVQCNTRTCGPGPVDGGWSVWSGYSPCSATCGFGSHMRTRSCNQPSPANGGRSCRPDGLAVETNSIRCQRPSCSQWNIWGAWSGCSRTCGIGVRVRRRTCPFANNCPGSATDTGSCNVSACDMSIPGQWTQWTGWSQVGTCYGCPRGSYRQRTRNCTSPKPMKGGAQCLGVGEQRGPCPVCQDGSFSDWSEWRGNCDEEHSQSRMRACTSPPPTNGGLNCSGPTTDERICPRFLPWSDWADSGNCSLCGEDPVNNIQVRHRQCNTTRIAACTGDLNQTRTCPACTSETNSTSCQGPSCSQWNIWGTWSGCSRTCGIGARMRMRTCPVANNCPGSATDTGSCNVSACDMSIPGQWTQWTGWSQVGTCYGCPRGSYRQRTRNCTSPKPMKGGAQCLGAREQRGPCPVCQDGGFSDWSEWRGNCDEEHSQSRMRACTSPPPTNGGLNCSGPTTDERICARFLPWSDWADSGSCSLCGEDPVNNIQVRHRQCNTTRIAACTGDLNQSRTCPACTSEQAGGVSGGAIAGIVAALLAILAVAVAVILIVT
ncbi:A disintegrin and metalloproteinase with thrombospondin motifs adt-2-like [Sycon ciliatum]|uniref:A disintegrin and metalloproteinase with thrombospondin motifs adt-2-like n=1 Tax=Sycon ciliatum TaxID=27933 RepID=UPI0031F6565A